MLDPIETLVDSINGTYWFELVKILASYDRYAFSSGNIAARDFLFDQLAQLGNLEVILKLNFMTFCRFLYGHFNFRERVNGM